MTRSSTSAACSSRSRRSRPEQLAAGLLLPLGLGPGRALAHGGVHESVDVGEAPADGGRPVVATNYGLLVPAAGEDWAWVCEEVVGPQGFSALVEVDGRWFLGSFAGLQASDGLCDWPLVGGGTLDDLFVTSVQGDPATPGRLWVTTATGDAENALWRSDDLGESWQAEASFGEGTTLRGFGQDPSGRPRFAVGWDGTQPMAWIAPDGESWQAFPIPPEDVYSLSLLGVADGAAWLRVVGADQDALVRLDPDGTLTERLRIDDTITAFDAGPTAGTLSVGGRETGLRHSADGGQSWGEAVLAPSPGCLRTRGAHRYLCSDNLGDGAGLLRTPLAEGDSAAWTWEAVAWYGDVRGVLDCPADSDVVVACAELWENASPEAGFDLEQGGADSGGADGGAQVEGDAPPGCCGGGASGAWLLAPLVVLGRRRR